MVSRQGEFFIQSVDRNDMAKQSGDDIFVVTIYPYPEPVNEYGRELPTLELSPINMGRLMAAGGVPGQYRVDYLLQVPAHLLPTQAPQGALHQ